MIYFTEEENKKISELTVLVAGCGGLGTNQAQILQRIGIKKIYLVDFDKIEESNLNRQILYSKEDIGKKKTEVAKFKLDNNSLLTKVISINKKIDKNFIIPDDVDVVIDALDNFKSRFVLEELSLNKKIPFIHGGINSMYGQVTTITEKSRNKLSDLIHSESKEKIESFLPLIAIIASIQVNECIKIYLNKKNNLINKILLVDIEDYSFDILDVN